MKKLQGCGLPGHVGNGKTTQWCETCRVIQLAQERDEVITTLIDLRAYISRMALRLEHGLDKADIVKSLRAEGMKGKDIMPRVFAEKDEVLHKELLCDKCGVNPKQEPHTCPYAVDISGDEETLCTCCAGCENECAYDI